MGCADFFFFGIFFWFFFGKDYFSNIPLTNPAVSRAVGHLLTDIGCEAPPVLGFQLGWAFGNEGDETGGGAGGVSNLLWIIRGRIVR